MLLHILFFLATFFLNTFNQVLTEKTRVLGNFPKLIQSLILILPSQLK